MTKSVPERLAALGAIYEERNKMYGNDYKHFGKILQDIFPKGINLITVKDFNRFALFILLLSKLTRYSKTLKSEGHGDSLDDLAVYAQMLRECDDNQ